MLERMRSLTAEQIAELKVETEEPHRGYTPIVRELRNVSDQLISLRAQLGRMQPRDVTYMPRPLMVGDIVNERQTDLVRSELDELIKEGHANAERLGLN